MLPTPPATPELTHLGRLRLTYIKSLNKKVILSMRSLKQFFFFTYLILIDLALGNHGFEVYSKLWELSCL